MPDRGVNAVDRGQASVDDVLTPRLAARFERVLALDESGGPRDATRGRGDRLGPGLFELAMRHRAESVTASHVPDVVDVASRHALAAALRARGQEILALAEASADDDAMGSIDASAEARLARVAAEAASIEALLDGAIVVCGEIAVSAGTDAAVAWFVRVAPSVDVRLEHLALGVVAEVPDRGPSLRGRATTLGDRLVAARRQIEQRLRARDDLALVSTTRASAIDAAAAEARAAITAAIEAELASTIRAIETTRTRELAAVEQWLAAERPRVEAAAYAAHREARDGAERAHRVARDAAHADRLDDLAKDHADAMTAIDRAHAEYRAAIEHRYGEVEALRARRERRLDELARIEEANVRMIVAQQEHRLHDAALAAALVRATRVDEEALRARDRAIALAEAAEAAARMRSEARYQARLRDATNAHEAAERAAHHALAQASIDLERVAAAKRAAIERDAVDATRAAHDHAVGRREREIEAAADAAARARGREIEEQLAALAEIVRGDRDG